MIDNFKGDHSYLSNFYSAPVYFQGIIYQNNEAAFQSVKLLDEKERWQFRNLDPSTAKKKGRRVKLRPDWEEIKDDIMYEIVKEKFTNNKDLRQKLLNTGDELLIEGNTWGDRYWGVCKGQGKNILGQILMTVREELRSE